MRLRGCYNLPLLVGLIPSLTRATQWENLLSVTGICNVISRILFNHNLNTVSFDISPRACIRSAAWCCAGLAVRHLALPSLYFCNILCMYRLMTWRVRDGPPCSTF